jgi:hypothetical protein
MQLPVRSSTRGDAGDSGDCLGERQDRSVAASGVIFPVLEKLAGSDAYSQSA